ncbi:putative ABC transport system substrate-binding protein [Rhizobium binae]|uniref:ABC transport system substrate-binding protein n=1 Tax=Rhizobium binae TaxID=1138190 RepID=A0ABV2MFU5_9HYPH|nr:ABC transporter substrate-binding protein [Rhizobium binae]NKL47091.1 hypothetical protein [Rhizobium leguminosarum bv. viciae]QSY83723.1 ABC transporter substrate-binding protein [Rhizobium binae]
MSKGHLIGAAIPRIGMLLAGDRSYPSFTAFCDGLAALAHIEGQTFEMEARFAAGQLDQLSSLAEELVALRVDIIAVIGAVTLQAVRRVTSDIPIVFTVVLDPVVAGLVRDAERPGGNATGVTNFDPEQARTQISILKQTVPNLSRLAIMGDAGVPDTLPNLYTAEAEAAGLRPQMVLLRGAEDIEAAFAAFRSDGAEALLSLEVPRTSTHGEQIAERAMSARMPTMFARDLAHHGPLLAYGTSLSRASRQMAGMWIASSREQSLATCRSSASCSLS